MAKQAGFQRSREGLHVQSRVQFVFPWVAGQEGRSANTPQGDMYRRVPAPERPINNRGSGLVKPHLKYLKKLCSSQTVEIIQTGCGSDSSKSSENREERGRTVSMVFTITNRIEQHNHNRRIALEITHVPPVFCMRHRAALPWC